MENKVFQPIQFLAKNEEGVEIYNISENVGWRSTITINLTVRGNSIDEVEKYVWRAIVAMREAQAERKAKERAAEEELGELMAKDVVSELIEQVRKMQQGVLISPEEVEVPLNLKEEEEDGR